MSSAVRKDAGASYKHVMKGKLSLKGGIKKKKKKKKKKIQGKTVEEHFSDFMLQRKREGTSAPANLELDAEEEEEHKEPQDATGGELVDTRTAAQKQFDLVQQQREEEMIKAKISKTHRSRVEEFNQYLANLSEHHDVPRVTPGPR